MSGREGEGFSERQKRVTAGFGARGFRLYYLDGSKMIVTRWGMTRVLADLDEAEQMLGRIGAVE